MKYQMLTPKLLRIYVESHCNYHCVFCYLPEIIKTASLTILKPEDYKWIVQQFIDSGCYRVHLTGGEPLLLNLKYLIPIVENIVSLDQLKSFWITTNGSLLYDNMCQDLKNVGLRNINISISAAYDNDYYRICNCSEDINLSYILRCASKAINVGLDVFIGIPLMKNGIDSYEKFISLVNKLKSIGVRNVAYWGLHKIKDVVPDFDKLYVDPDIITNALSDQKWNFIKTDTGKMFFSDGTIYVTVPEKIIHITQNCLYSDCSKNFCQGIYSANLMSTKDKIIIRACNRIFQDRRNEFYIDLDIIHNRDTIKLKKVITEVWRWAYQDS